MKRFFVVLSLAALAYGSGDDLAQHATIRRDTYGVPHITGDSEEAAAFAYGYAVSEDHFASLARLFLRAQGRQAEFLGSAFLEDDIRIRRLGIREVAERQFGLLPPLQQAVLDAYAEGYNRYLATHAAGKPEWAMPLRGVDVLAHCRLVLLLELTFDITKLFPRAAPTEPRGSNLWAIGRERSASGRGILLVNPHLSWSSPFVLYEAHLRVPGRLNIYGASFLGSPVISMGFNENLGWGHSVNAVNGEDMYELRLDAQDPHRYWYDGRLLPLRSRAVSLKVKTPQGTESREIVVEESHYGPILRESGGKAYALRSANLDAALFLDQWQRMGEAHNWKEFRAALNEQALPKFNIGYADREGNIYYLFNGRIPQRPGGYDWARPVPGDTSRSEWGPLYPIAELPQLFNPKEGYIQNCNNPPWFTTAAPRLDPGQFAGYIPDGELDFRGQFSLATLESKPRWRLEEVMASKYDETVYLAKRIKPDLLRIADSSTDPLIVEARGILGKWDDRAATASRGADLFAAWWADYTKSASQLYSQKWSRSSPLTTPSGIGDTASALKALSTAAQRLKSELGTLDVAWGDTHRFRRGTIDLPLGGTTQNLGAFRAVLYAKDKDGKWRGAAGDTYTLAVEFADSPVAYSVLPYSESSDPASPHFNDQGPLFATSRYKRVVFSEDDIRKSAPQAYSPPAEKR